MASAIILLPFYVEGLSTALFGKLSIFLALSLFVQIIVTYSFDSSVYIHYHEYKDNRTKLANFVSSSFILILIIGATTGLIAVVLGEFILAQVFRIENISFYPYGFASVVTGIMQSLFKVHSSLLQTRGKPEVFFFSNSLLFSLIVGLSIAGLVIYPETLVGPIGGRLVGVAVAGVWVLFRIFKEFGFRFDFAWLKESLSFNNYVFIYQVEQWVVNYFDRILLVFFLPVATVGVYDFGVKCLVVIELVMNGLHNSFLPKVVSVMVGNNEKQSEIEINKYYHGLIACVMILVTICIFSFPLGIEWLVPDKGYRDVIPYIPFLAIMYLPRVMKIYFGVPYSAKKHTKPLPIIYLGVALVKVSLIFLLVKQFGLYGVIVAGMVAAYAENLLLRAFIGNVYAFRYNFQKIVLMPSILFAVIALVEVSEAATLHIRHAFYIVFCLGLLWLQYSKELRLMISGILKRSEGETPG